MFAVWMMLLLSRACGFTQAHMGKQVPIKTFKTGQVAYTFSIKESCVFYDLYEHFNLFSLNIPLSFVCQRRQSEVQCEILKFRHSPFAVWFLRVSQMAHRLLLRRIWTLSAKDVRSLPASTAAATSSFSTSSLQCTATRASFLSPRSLPRSPRRKVSFNVQDHEDFTERVINSELPVLVDFHAQ